jgi:hypothetical protein
MPPQQAHRLADFINHGLDFGAHDGIPKLKVSAKVVRRSGL